MARLSTGIVVMTMRMMLTKVRVGKVQLILGLSMFDGIGLDCFQDILV